MMKGLRVISIETLLHGAIWNIQVKKSINAGDHKNDTYLTPKFYFNQIFMWSQSFFFKCGSKELSFFYYFFPKSFTFFSSAPNLTAIFQWLTLIQPFKSNLIFMEKTPVFSLSCFISFT